MTIAALTLTGFGGAHAQVQQREPFETWRAGFEARLSERGVDPAIVESMMTGLEPDPSILERDSSQPEFVRPVWVYLNGAASQARTDNGLAAQAEHAAALAVVANAYPVDPDILTAIWGLESAYGVIQGDFDLVRSLATLAWDGRRRDWAESQLFAAAEMITRGYAAREDLLGSWAGAMGQTQFIPTTYLERAVDMTGDGRRDIWNDEADALGSAANLLTRAGWEGGAPVAYEVELAADFDYAAWSPQRRRATSAWALDGVSLADGDWAADDLYRTARVLVPAGANGPAFIVFSNFDALLRYNNSTAYALGVAYLAKRLAGLDALPDGWPEDDVPLTRTQARELQEALTGLGYDTGGVDGMIGPNSRAALRAFQAANAMTPDGYAGMRAYEAVRAAGQE
jgi:membrane-bound lytic murein transglycosylase B